MLKELVDLRTFSTFGIPTSGKELTESIRYAQVAGIGRYRWAFTLDDLVGNLRAPESMKRCHSSQYLDATLDFNMGPGTSKGRGTPVGPPFQTRIHPPPLTPDT